MTSPAETSVMMHIYGVNFPLVMICREANKGSCGPEKIFCDDSVMLEMFLLKASWNPPKHPSLQRVASGRDTGGGGWFTGS